MLQTKKPNISKEKLIKMLNKCKTYYVGNKSDPKNAMIAIERKGKTTGFLNIPVPVIYNLISGCVFDDMSKKQVIRTLDMWIGRNGGYSGVFENVDNMKELAQASYSNRYKLSKGEIPKSFKNNNIISLKIETNEYREEVVTEKLRLETETNIIYHEELLCHQARGMGMGNCRCDNHKTWRKKPMSLMMVEKILQEGVHVQ